MGEGLRNELIQKIERLKAYTTISKQIQIKIETFSQIRHKKDPEELFLELCFCILTANYTSEGGIRVHGEIGNDFLTLEETQLAKRLTEVRYRFPNLRAKYIVKAREERTRVVEAIGQKWTQIELRNFLAQEIYGLGLKEASHYLRNIGFFEVAILDFHIIDILERHGIIKKPKTLTKSKYLSIEKKLDQISKMTKLTQGELDFYLWYMETGKILK
ncbi:N-glycosylase/DNA lyase [Candidatus Micrarchaeota archaeon]|nr:N-glycosylase/DNA lyase [Candidatus Micrarchaeota archaeon]